MPFTIVRNDITQMHVDAIVNAANNRLLAGGGVCGAIFQAAGADRLQKACNKIGYVDTGKAVITEGYRLFAKYIIHTAGPVWRGGSHQEEELLYSCYKESLSLAKQYKLNSIAFPLISSGIYGYPKEEALQVAVRAIGDFLAENDMDVVIAVYDRQAFQICGQLYQAIEAYIDDYYVEGHFIAESRSRAGERASALHEAVMLDGGHNPTCLSAMPHFSDTGLEDALSHLDESFSQSLLRLIDEKKMTDVETYKKANIDRKLFSKIRSNVNYKPKKTTAIALAVALELSLDETNALLRKAGYILSHSSKFDVIIEFFIQNHNYNIMEINEALFAFDQVLLGC